MKIKLHLTLTLTSIAIIPALLGQNSFPTNGNVGVGQPTPTFGETTYGGAVPLLHVFNPGEADSFRPIARFQSGTDANYTGAAIVINHANDRGLIIEAGRGYSNQAVAYFGLLNNLGVPSRFMSVLEGGKIGIGTDSPQSKFHIQGTGSELTLKADGVNSSNSGSIIFDEGDGGKHFRIIYDGSGKANGSHGRLIFSNAGQSDLMTIERNGMIGIGTSDPTQALSVNGTIQAKEVIVETGWSDFVFEDSYRLRSLGEIESHIEEYGHLPDVPSAAVVESEGLSVGESQKIMMQKIEELTLYMIDLKKENDSLKAEVGAQREEINRLKSN